MTEIRNTSKHARIIHNTGKTARRINPDVVGAALGAQGYPKVRVLVLRTGYVESTSTTCLIARHDEGFPTVEDALRHFGQCIVQGLLTRHKRDVQEEDYRFRRDPSYYRMIEQKWEPKDRDVQNAFLDLFGSDADSGGAVMSAVIDKWNLWGNLQEGEFDYRVELVNADEIIAMLSGAKPDSPEEVPDQPLEEYLEGYVDNYSGAPMVVEN